MLWEDESKSKVTLSDCQLKQGISKQNMLFLQYFSKNWSTKIVSYYHGPPKPTFLEVSMVNDLVFKWPKPWFWGFMVKGEPQSWSSFVVPTVHFLGGPIILIKLFGL